MSKRNSPEAKTKRRLEREAKTPSIHTKRQMWVKTKNRYGKVVQTPVMMPILKGRS